MSKFLLYDDGGYREMTDADWFDCLQSQAEICRWHEATIDEILAEARATTGKEQQELLVGLTCVLQNVIDSYTQFLSYTREMMSDATPPDEGHSSKETGHESNTARMGND